MTTHFRAFFDPQMKDGEPVISRLYIFSCKHSGQIFSAVSLPQIRLIGNYHCQHFNCMPTSTLNSDTDILMARKQIHACHQHSKSKYRYGIEGIWKLYSMLCKENELYNVTFGSLKSCVLLSCVFQTGNDHFYYVLIRIVYNTFWEVLKKVDFYQEQHYYTNQQITYSNTYL